LSVEFRYDLVGVGWSECTLIIDDTHVTVTASYLSDALRDLVAAVSRVTAGLPDATASFDEEPGEYRWRLFRIDTGANDYLPIMDMMAIVRNGMTTTFRKQKSEN
jgi:hypothetical protein